MPTERPSLYSQSKLAHECVSVTGPIFIKHRPDDSKQTAYTYLHDHTGSNEEKDTVNTLFTPESQWKYSFPGFNPYGTELNQLDDMLRQILRPVYNAATQSLNASDRYGFNRHDELHIDFVTGHAVPLIKTAGFGDDVVRRTIIAARAHDIGNLVTRKAHALASTKLLPLIIPQITSDDTHWGKIKKSIMLHSDSEFEAALIALGGTSFEKQINILSNYFPPEVLAIIIADKINVGRERISNKGNETLAVNHDRHLLLNLLGKTNGIFISPNGKDFVWELQFTPHLEDEDLELFDKLLRRRSQHHGIRALVPDTLQALYRSPLPIPHSSSWRSMFINEYYKRIMMTVLSAFALFPSLEIFHLRSVDLLPEKNTGIIETTTTTFVRDMTDEALETFRTKYISKDQRKKTRFRF